MSLGNLHRVHINSILEPTLSLADLDVVTTHLSLAHLAVLGKGPVFETITPHPLSGLDVFELIPELHRDLVVAKSEQLLAEAIFLLYSPFASQKADNGLSPAEEVVSIAPYAVWSISLRDVFSTRSWDRI